MADVDDWEDVKDEGPPGAPLEPGNIDLKSRPVVKNPDGTISTVRSMGVNIGGKEVLIPTVSDDGRVLSDDDAIALYKQTGRHLGKFKTPDEATAYAQKLHRDQEKLYVPPDQQASASDGADDWQDVPSEKPAAPKGEEPDWLTKKVRAGLQGFYGGYADNLRAGIDAVPRAIKGENLGAAYEDELKKSRKDFNAATAENPGSTLVGALLQPGPKFKALKGLPKFAAYLAYNAGTGGLEAVGHSDTDLTTEEGRSKALEGAGIAAGTTAALGAAGAAVRKVAPGLKDLAIAQGRRAISGGADSLSGRRTIRPEAVWRALEEGGIKPFDNVRNISDRLTKTTERAGELYNQILEGLQARGVKGPKAAEIAGEFMREASSRDANSLGTGIPDMFKAQAQELLSKPQAEGTLGLHQAESIKRSLQKQAKYGRFEDTPKNEAMQDAAAIVRRAVEHRIDEAGKTGTPEVRFLAEKFKPAKARLGDLIETDTAAFKGAEQASRRNAFSLRDILFGAAAMGGGMTTGLGGAAAGPAAAVASHLARTRGTSTVAVMAHRLNRLVERPMGRYQQLLRDAASRSPQALVALDAVLSKDPEYAAARSAALEEDQE